MSVKKITNEEIISEVNFLLQSLNYKNIKIDKISIYHSSSVEVAIEDLDANIIFMLNFNYCYYFKGRADVWTNTNLVLEYSEGFRKLGKRNLPENLFILRDLDSGSFIKSLYLDFSTIKSKSVNKYEEDPKRPYEGTNIELIRSVLQKKEISRVMIFNSKAPLLHLRIDNHLSYFVDLPTIYESIELLCDDVIYMNVDLFLWETTQGFSLEREDEYLVLTEKEHNYQIKCKSIRLLEQKG
ncbi:hypothetical protein QNI19_11810 [Cytophagaceae bacterium DM2B3-1]|uniref:Uncharacterized protein n=1 Tax=Xanthocytophaga flava TaxID=3048013 RepID=A0ABT7CIS4_9BACT|nr:hypothetical protein [Xanthocytophaga flavus]MDJ1469672.1 hypothetical protein [Xanthocytophaga flavus]MDJ1493620.1 hypothetical protein [Xanthocytophaga flavus]